MHEDHTSAKVGAARSCHARGLRLGRSLATALTLIGGLGALLTPLTPVRAIEADLVCKASVQAHFAPALDNNTVSLTYSVNFDTCISPNGSQPGLHSGVVHGSGTITGCVPALFTASGDMNVTWNTGQTTTGTMLFSDDPLTGGISFSAQFNSGVMAGGHGLGLPLLFTQDGLCGLGGVRSATFEVAALAFVH